MSAWTEGYVAEIPYTPGYYRELSPALIALNLAIRGYASPDIAQPFNYCELGYGLGLSLTLHAACFPQARFWGTDFNPAHAAHAQSLATDGGLTNLMILDDSFEQLLARDLPPMDFIVLHGIYSWISPKNRSVIVDFIDRRLRPGGIVYVSYNTLPGWASVAPLRELMRLHGERASPPGLPMPERVQRAIAFAGELHGRKARYFQSVVGLDGRIEKLKTANPNYVAHEYMNREWHPQYFSEVAGEMSAARLTYAGAANLSDNVEAALLPAETLRFLAGLADPVLSETVRDFFLNTQFRRDLYTRGAARLSATEQSRRLMDWRWEMIVARAAVNLKIGTSGGDVTLDEKAFAPLLDRLVAGGASARELLADASIAEIGTNRLLQGLILLTGAGYLQPLLPEALVQAGLPGVLVYNRAAARAATTEIVHLACPLTGLGVGRSNVSLLHSRLHAAGHTEPEGLARAVHADLQANGKQIVRNGQALDDLDAAMEHLVGLAREFLDRELPHLRRLGLAE